MTRVFFFFLFISIVILLLGLVEIFLLRQLNRKWWEKKTIRLLAIFLPVFGILFINLFGIAEYHKIVWLSAIGGFLTAIALVLEVSLMISLPISGVIHLSEKIYDHLIGKNNKLKQPSVNQSRRLFLRGAAALVPATALGIGVTGVGRAYEGARVLPKKFTWQQLSLDLQNLKILHLSDLHLHHYVTLHDLESLLVEAEPYQPDVILISGDIADDLTQLPDALKLVNELKPPLGSYASLGNHEYYRGVRKVRDMFERSSVRLLINEGVTIQRGQSRLFVGGVDDPVGISQFKPDFFEKALDKIEEFRKSDNFSLLMSHRPDIFPLAADRKIELTLAGHTHGGQVGLWGRSLLEKYFPEKYLWGHYQNGNSQLYTSSGVGHWFPFRFGCPPEAPLITLLKE